MSSRARMRNSRLRRGETSDELKIDQRRVTLGRNQPVRFLGQVVMNYARAVQAPQQPEGSTKEAHVARACKLHGKSSIQPRLNTPAEKS